MLNFGQEKNVAPIFSASGPLSLIIDTAPAPCGVAIAVIVVIVLSVCVSRGTLLNGRETAIDLFLKINPQNKMWVEIISFCTMRYCNPSEQRNLSCSRLSISLSNYPSTSVVAFNQEIKNDVFSVRTNEFCQNLVF